MNAQFVVHHVTSSYDDIYIQIQKYKYIYTKIYTYMNTHIYINIYEKVESWICKYYVKLIYIEVDECDQLTQI